MNLSEKIERSMTNALDFLFPLLSVQTSESETHRIVIISGWDSNDANLKAIAQYLVGLLASAISSTLQIRAILDDSAVGSVSLHRDVCIIIGREKDSLDDRHKTDERNPWIAEGLWHLCLTIASRSGRIFHPNGDIIAVQPPHVRAKDHGLDGLAIYMLDSSTLGLSFVETKAYKDNPSQAISRAASYFKELDEGIHDSRIRQSVLAIRDAMPGSQQTLITGSLWNRLRTYIANPHYDSSAVIDLKEKRPSFERLLVPRDNIFVMPHIIKDFDVFFETVSEEMRAFCEECKSGV